MGLQNADGANRWQEGGGIEGLMGNPIFQAGLAVASDGGNDPAGAIAQGLFTAQRSKDASSERKATKKARDRQEKLYERLQEAYAQQPQAAPALAGQPQMSPVAQPPVSAQQMLAQPQVPGVGQVPQQGLPGAGFGGYGTPPINGQDPYAAGGYPFGSAPGSTNGAPGAQDIGALLLQYGTPQQQQAAYTQMSAGERYRQGLAAEEARYRRKQSDQGDIGKATPSNYTPESLARYAETRNFNDLERYERIRQVDIGGVEYNIDSVTGKTLGPVAGGLAETVSNTAAIKDAEVQASKQAASIADAEVRLNTTNRLDTQISNLINDEAFSGAVGPVDQYTGGIGASLFGAREGVLGKEAERLSNQLVVDVAEKWKGAISDRELELFKESVPRRGDHPEVWRSWYNNEFLPKKAEVERIISGEAFQRGWRHPESNATGAAGTQGGGTTSNGLQWSIEP